MTRRKLLPQRRKSLTFTTCWGGMNRIYTVTCGYYDDNTLGEIFITGAKSGEQIEAVARDGAVATSIALQFGATPEILASAITRDPKGIPQTILGTVLDEIIKGEYDRF